MADGQPKALLIPLDGDAASAHEAYVRGRALLALRRELTDRDEADD